jgi:hypothetical protein
VPISFEASAGLDVGSGSTAAVVGTLMVRPVFLPAPEMPYALRQLRLVPIPDPIASQFSWSGGRPSRTWVGIVNENGARTVDPVEMRLQRRKK